MFNTTPNLISPDHVKSLSNTRGWVITFAILLFIFAVVLILGSIGNIMRGTNILGPLVNILVGLFYIFAGVKFCSYFGKINTAAQTQNSVILESAIEAQAKAWMWLGISSVIYLVLFIIAFLIGLFAVM